MSRHQNPMAVYKLNSAKKIIVQSPQPSDIGELTENNEVRKNKRIEEK